MIILIHLLEHLGVPSGIAIGVVIAVMKVVKGGGRKLGARHDADSNGHHQDHRDKR